LSLAMFGSDAQSASLVPLLRATAEADAGLVLLVLLGALFTFRGVFDQRGVSDLGRLVYHITLPCLLFGKILKEFSLERVRILWILPASCAAHVLAGFLMAQAAARTCRLDKMERKVATACTMFGNVGALAIAVVDSLCHSEALVAATGDQQECSSVGISYIAFYLITQNILMFTWGESMMLMEPSLPVDGDVPGDGDGEEPHPADEEATVAERAEDDPIDAAVVQRVSLDSAPGLERASYSLKLGHDGLAQVQSYLPLESHYTCDPHEESMSSRTSSGKADPADASIHAPLIEPGPAAGAGGLGGRKKVSSGRLCFRSCRKAKARAGALLSSVKFVLLRLARNPSLQAAAAAVVLACSPSVKKLFVSTAAEESAGHGTPVLYFVYDALTTLGKAQVPVSMLMLSGTATLRYMEKIKQIAGDPGTSFAFTRRCVCVILFSRTIAMPIAGLGWWWLLKRLHLVPEVPGRSALMELVVLIESAVPTAQNVVMLLLVHREMEKGQALAQVVIMQMCVAIATFTIACAFFQWLVLLQPDH